MTDVDYLQPWKLITSEVVSTIQSERLSVASVYLVGSQVERHTPSSDFDALFVLKDQIDVWTARALRKRIDAVLVSFFHSQWYHYKVLTHDSLRNMAEADGFRLASLQQQHLLYSGRNVLMEYRPCLDEKNFVNAVLIQATYCFFLHLPSTDSTVYRPRLNAWTTRNREINPAVAYPHSEFHVTYFRERNPLMCTLSEFFNCTLSDVGLSKLCLYINRYCNLFTHEAVNKYDSYLRSLITIMHDSSRSL